MSERTIDMIANAQYSVTGSNRDLLDDADMFFGEANAALEAAFDKMDEGPEEPARIYMQQLYGALRLFQLGRAALSARTGNEMGSSS